MDPTSTNVEERDQWRARISRALSDLQSHSTFLEAAASSDASDCEASSDSDNV